MPTGDVHVLMFHHSSFQLKNFNSQFKTFQQLEGSLLPNYIENRYIGI